MLLFSEIGGYTLGEADALRKAKSLEPERERFVKGALKKGFTLEEANELFDRFDFGYSFNKSHACAYGTNTFTCAWYKTYYYKEFMASAMTLELTQQEPKISEFVAECRGNGVEILPPDINNSSLEWIPTEKGILTPFNCISGIAGKCSEAILEYRPYKSFDDFLERVPKSKVKKNNVINLIKCGAFDCFDKNRTHLIEYFLKSRKEEVPVLPFWCDDVRYVYEGEILGFYCSKHPLDGYINKSIMDFEEGREISINGIIETVKEHIDKNGNKMAFIKCSNLVGSFDVTVFSRTYSKYSPILKEKRRLNFKGKLNGSVLLNVATNI
jgi:DNA polymerase-3 subunit alpha